MTPQPDLEPLARDVARDMVLLALDALEAPVTDRHLQDARAALADALGALEGTA